MKDLIPLVLFQVEAQRYAVSLSAVQRIVRAVEVTRLLKGPPIVLGIIDVEGRILPVINFRKRLGLPEREISPVDQFVIAQTTRRTLVVVVDKTLGVIERAPGEIVETASVVPGLPQIQGVIQLADGLVLVHDLETFLSLDESRTLDEAINLEARHEN